MALSCFAHANLIYIHIVYNYWLFISFSQFLIVNHTRSNETKYLAKNYYLVIIQIFLFDYLFISPPCFDMPAWFGHLWDKRVLRKESYKVKFLGLFIPILSYETRTFIGLDVCRRRTPTLISIIILNCVFFQFIISVDMSVSVSCPGSILHRYYQ
jgi:hypothetical protein